MGLIDETCSLLRPLLTGTIGGHISGTTLYNFYTFIISGRGGAYTEEVYETYTGLYYRRGYNAST